MHTKNWLQWRYATKKFDTSKELRSEDIEQILEAGNLAATCYGLQPFGIVVVSDQEKRKALVPHAYNQGHIEENGVLLVLAARTDINEAMVTEYTNRIERVRELPQGSTAGFKNTIMGDIGNRTPEARLVWAQKQAYIALGTMMVAASELDVDNCPMEGFDPLQFNAILGLDAHNLHATVLLALGYRSKEDVTQAYKKVRRPLTDLVVRI